MPGTSENSTKEKIINASIRLFNNSGIANVRLQQIAEEIGISTGNLAYHFRNKKAIVEAINEELSKEASHLLTSYRSKSNFLDFDEQLTTYFTFIKKYPFYFIDFIELDRQYPSIVHDGRLIVSKIISQIRKRFDYNHARGTIVEEPELGIYDSAAQSIWMTLAFWVPNSMVTNTDHIVFQEDFKRAIWNQVYPFMTNKGRKEFEKYIIPTLEKHSSDN